MSTLVRFIYIAASLILCISDDTACTPTDRIAIGNKNVNVYNQFTFVTRKEWDANNWRNDICSCNINDTTQMVPLSQPYIITIHHTESPLQSNNTNDSISSMKQIQQFHQYTRIWCDIAYHFLIDSAGNVFQGRPFWDDNQTFVEPLNISYKWPNPRLIQGSHSLNSNTNNIGISVIGCYDTNSTNCPKGINYIARYDRTYTRLIQLISWICNYYDIQPSNNTIVRHKYWKDTACPGNILGSKKLFNDIIEDTQITVDDGNGLCYDYSNRNGYGRCIDKNECSDDMILDTGNENQCENDHKLVCCKIITNNNDKDSNKNDWGSVYIIIGIFILLVLLIVIALMIKKRREQKLKNGKFGDLTQVMQENDITK